MKVIPAIDLMEGQVVRLYQGKPENKTVYSNDPLGMAKKWEKAGADMLHLVDLDATLQRGSNLKLIEKIVKEVSIPTQIAGGLRTESIISESLDFAQRVVLGTIAFKDMELVSKLATKFGTNKIVISADHNNGMIVVNGWQQSTSVNLITAMQNFTGRNFSEFLVTNVSRDGTMKGPDLDYLKKACSFSNANVIASGGISNLDDITAVKNCNAYGVILGKALYEGKVSIEEAKKLA
ncbi:MAG: 1-(5-phosphoribosyl)-5-[(5-phosphoribosylamino)methylideneamino]imidazole-4-carboxamide isomerase [Candidatus Nitrosotenuis sp.]|nr:MAG: 1-(5-phosphoribosyl)-5-[(5-phosphoribosylamino)methylideneamino]imidazole-4-carboxamide isomerase [Candidatus Nitrosotenuis sp.]